MTQLATASRVYLTVAHRSTLALRFQPCQHQARHASTSGSTSKQLRSKEESDLEKNIAARRKADNFKHDMPIKFDEEAPFDMKATYIRPKQHGFRFLSEKWAVYQYARFLNWFQTGRVSRTEFGFFSGILEKVNRGRRQAVIMNDLLPLYRQINEAQTKGIPSSLKDRLSPTLGYKINESHRRRAQKGGTILDWRWHTLNNYSVKTMRSSAIKKGELMVQMALRIDSMQSLEERDTSGRLLASSGSHARPQRVLENYLFQRRIGTDTSHTKWKAIKALPSLTPMQAIGSQSEQVKELTGRRKRSALTIVG